MTAPAWSPPTLKEWASPLDPPSVPLVPPDGLRTVKPLLRYVATLTDFTQRDLTGPCRDASLAKARHIIIWLARRFTGRTLPEIGRILGGRDHTTILHGARRVARVIPYIGTPTEDTPEAWAWMLWSRQWPPTGRLFR